MKIMTRSYTLKARAKTRERTRQRIVEAAIDLHKSKGPAATTMEDVAKQAKVGRVTVYRHFPDSGALLGACSGQYFQRFPLPDPTPWRAIENPVDRFRHGLGKVYTYHAQTEDMMAGVLADLGDHPALDPYRATWHAAADVLAEAFGAPEKERPKLRAALAVAVDFHTWRILAGRHRLNTDEAVEVMLRLVCK